MGKWMLTIHIRHIACCVLPASRDSYTNKITLFKIQTVSKLLKMFRIEKDIRYRVNKLFRCWVLGSRSCHCDDVTSKKQTASRLCCFWLLIQFISTYSPYLEMVSSIRTLGMRHVVVQGTLWTWSNYEAPHYAILTYSPSGPNTTSQTYIM
jgi:hypothetical protein